VRATWCAHRARVGCDAKGGAVSGRRARRSLPRGAWRRGLAALASAEPAALCHTRGVSRACQGKWTRRGARGSVSTAARARVKPRGSSGSLSRRRPASEDKRPPSQSRATALSPTGARGRRVTIAVCRASTPGSVSAWGSSAFMWVHSCEGGGWTSYYRTLGSESHERVWLS